MVKKYAPSAPSESFKAYKAKEAAGGFSSKPKAAKPEGRPSKLDRAAALVKGVTNDIKSAPKKFAANANKGITKYTNDRYDTAIDGKRRGK